MEEKSKRNRKGYIGVNLARGGDMTLYNRVKEEVESDPELDRSKLVRLALTKYFKNKDSKKTK